MRLFVRYQCDRKTPAWYVSKVENNSITQRVPLDFTNPAVVVWQVSKKTPRPAMNALNINVLKLNVQVR